MTTINRLQAHLTTPINNLGSIAIKENAQQVVCKDGTSLSVQASEFHYSTPRENRGPYYQVEVGFPSTDPPSTWNSYDCGDGVWGYVPIELVAKFIDEHGGPL